MARSITRTQIRDIGNLLIAGSSITIEANGRISSTVSLLGLTTANVNEGSNLYYTNSRVYSAIVGNLTLKANVVDLTTANVSEGNNLYYTNARVRSTLSGGTGVSYNESTGQISIGQDIGTSNNVTFANLTVSGDLVVQGNTVTLNTSTVNIEDKNLLLANGAINAAAADGAGITIDGASATITYVNATNSWNLNKDIIVTSNVTANIFNGNLTGNVTGTAGTLSNFTTANLSEGNNLYYTNARVYANITAALAGNVTAGNLNVNIFTANSYTTTGNINAGNVIANSAVFGSGIGGSITGANLISGINIQGNSWIGLYTANVVESSSALYYTNARVYSAIVGNLALKANIVDLTTANVSELTNLYYTNSRVYSAIVGNLELKANIVDLTTSNVTEGNNLYYTNSRVNSNVIAFLPSLAGQYIRIQANGQINANLSTDATIIIAANGQIRSNSSGGGGSVTVTNDTTSNSNTFYLLLANNTASGSLSAVNVSNTKLYFNANTGTLNSTIFNSLSDETTKTNLVRIVDALSKLSALGGYTYLMIDSNEPSAGLLSQQVQKVLPEAVKYNPDTGLLSLNYNAVLGLVVEAVKELENRVSSLENAR